MDLVALDTAAALDQISGIDLFGQEFMDRAGAPHGIIACNSGDRQTFRKAIGCRAWNAVLVQVH